MNRDYLISKIAEQLKGKLIKRGWNWEIEYQIRDTMENFFDKEDFKNISVEKDRYANLLIVRYKRHFLFDLRYTKTKGENHYSYCDTHTDYYFKDFVCSDQEQDFDLKKKMYEIEIKIIDEGEAKEQLFKEMTENYKKVVALFGDKTTSVLNYFDRHKYNLERAIKDEK